MRKCVNARVCKLWNWGFDEKSIKENWYSPSVKEVTEFINRFKSHDGAVTFNLPCYQDGSFLESDIAVLHKVNRTKEQL